MKTYFIIVGVLWALWVGVILGSWSQMKIAQTEAINQGYAEYNSTTAEFQWIKK